MVDALRRARELVTADGWIVDIHPTAAVARVEVGARVIGPIESGDAPSRHQAATRAIETAVADRILRLERSLEFDFYTYGDSIEELAEYIHDEWRNARIPDETIARARDVLLTAPDARPRVTERVQLSVLRRGDGP
jgi:hypothetical protein